MKGKIIFVSNCILNQYARAKNVRNRIDGLAAVYPLLDLFKEENVAIVQMPCPEIEYEGLQRVASSRARYENDEFKAICRTYAKAVASLVKQYVTEDYRVVGILGVDYSPTCGVDTLPRRRQGSEPSGLFMREIQTELAKNGLRLKLVGARIRTESQAVETQRALEKMLNRIEGDED